MWDSEAKVWAFAVSPWLYDPTGIHCYPASFSAKSDPLPDDAPAVDVGDTCTGVMPNSDVSGYSRSSAAPNGLANQTQDECCAACNKAKDCTAWVRTSDGKPDGSGMNCWLFRSGNGTCNVLVVHFKLCES